MAQKPSEPSPIEGQLSFLDAAAAPVEASTTHRDTTSTPTPADDVPDDADAALLVGPNTRIRAGNAMQRARAGAVRGALETLMRRGLRRLTMSETADRGGLARATLYNHVRDKDELLVLLVEHEAGAVADVFVAAPTMEAALTAAADMIAEHPVLIALREREPEALVRLAVPESGAIRGLAADALAARGAPASANSLELLLRWLVSFVSSPSDAAARAEQARALARMLG